MKPFRARYRGTCYRCGKPIAVGQPISWNRRKKGSAAHWNCQDVDALPPQEQKRNKAEKGRARKSELEAEAMPSGNAEATLDALAAALSERLVARAELDEDKVRKIAFDVVAELLPTPLKVELPSGDTVTLDATHENFPKLLFYVAQGHHTYLYGEPGSGKSHGARQAADALKRAFGYISLNPQTPDSRLLGYLDATSNYRPTVFRKLYETGGVFCIDELDNAAPSLLTTLNSALENGWASFPDGMIPRHADFVLVATGNTCGKGANPAFPERRPFDSAFADRFSYLAWGYDKKLEKTIALRINPEAHVWIAWVQTLRQWSKTNMPRLLVTPRATFKLAQYTKGKAPLTHGELVDAVIFRGLDTDARDKALSANPLPE